MEWPAIIDGALTLVIAGATVALFFATRSLVAETRRLSQVTSTPQPLALIEPNRWAMHFADLIVRNAGNAAAFDVEIEFDPAPPVDDVRADKGVPLSSISALLPGQEIRSYLVEFEHILDTTFTITVSWKAHPQATTRDSITYTQSMAAYRDRTMLGASDPFIQIAEDMKKLREATERISKK